MKLTSILKEHILTEGRVDNARKKYVGKTSVNGKRTLTDELFQKLVDADPSGNQKYLDWMSRVFINDEKAFADGKKYVDAMSKLIKDFHQFSGKLEKKDINQWETASKLLDALEGIKYQYRLKKEGDNVDKVYEDDRFLVVIPKSHIASCKYGAGTKWCTTMKDNDQYFHNYTSKTGVLSKELYYILDKTKDTSDTEYKVAFNTSSNNYGKELVRIDAYNAPDKEIDYLSYLSDKPELWHIWDVKYSTSEKLIYGVELSDEEKENLNLENIKSPLARFLMVSSQDDNKTNIREDDIPYSILGNLESDEEIYINNNGITKFWFTEDKFEEFIENHEGIDWDHERYYFHIVGDYYYEDNYYDESEYDYFYSYMDNINVNRFKELMVKVQDPIKWDDEGAINNFLEKHFSNIWEDYYSDMLYEINSGVGRTRQESLSNELNTKRFRYSNWGNGYGVEIPTAILINLINENGIETFHELFYDSSLGEGINLEDTFYQNSEVDNEAVDQFNIEFDSMLDKLNEYFEDNNEYYSIIKDKLNHYGFKWDNNSTNYELIVDNIKIIIYNIYYEDLVVYYRIYKDDNLIDSSKIHIDEIPTLFTQKIPFEK